MQKRSEYPHSPNPSAHSSFLRPYNAQASVRGQAGCQSVWINLSGKNLNSFTEASVLPTLEINHLTELLTL